MTLTEFKAWFEGFTEAMANKDTPTPEQWAVIVAKIKSIHETRPVTDLYPIKDNRPWDLPKPWVPTWSTSSSLNGH